MPDPTNIRRPLALIILLSLLPLLSLGCMTSKGYQRLMARTVPHVAERMARYELTPEEAQGVSYLRDVTASESRVRYDTARPAWEAVAPVYRQSVALDALLPPQRKIDWLETADILDRGQRAEEAYRRSLGVAPPPGG